MWLCVLFGPCRRRCCCHSTQTADSGGLFGKATAHHVPCLSRGSLRELAFVWRRINEHYLLSLTPIHTRQPYNMAPGAQDAAMQMAETIQTAHLNHSPSVMHDINPSTAASHKEPIQLKREPSADDVISDVDEDEIPVSLLRPTPRKPQMPPLPDLRFEQSYLASIKDAQDWKVVTYITMRDQVCTLFYGMPCCI